MNKNAVLFNIFFLLMISTVSAGCIDFLEGARGDGNVVKEERAVKSFDGIDVSGAFEVILTQGDREKLVVEADENLLEIIITEVVNGTLKIYTKKDIRKAKTLNIYLTFKDLKSIDISGAVEIKGENRFNLDKLFIEGSGASEIDLSIKAKLLKVDFSGASEIELSGYCKEVELEVSGASELNAENLEVEILRMDVSGASEATVFVTQELHIDASGASSVRYKGDPKIYQDSSGASSVRSL